MENLKPQFTPGQAMLSPAQPGPSVSIGSTSCAVGPGSSTNIGLLQQEIETLKDQLKDMTEKYETLKGIITLCYV